MIIGGPGAGKTVAAVKIGKRLGLPVYHMDRDVVWLPLWAVRDLHDQERHVERIAALEAWVFEGSHSLSFQMRAVRADVLVYLDVPLRLRLWRLVLRTVRFHGRQRPDMAGGCRERVGRLPRLLWRAFWGARGNRKRSGDLFDRFEGPKHRLKTVQDVARFVKSLD